MPHILTKIKQPVKLLFGNQCPLSKLVGKRKDSNMESSLAEQLVNTGKLTVEQMLEVGNKANNWNVWQAVVKQIDFGKLTVKQMLEVGNKAKDWNVWQTFQLLALLPTSRICLTV